MVKAIFFDVDGTLFSSEAMIHKVYEAEFARWKAEHGEPQTVPSQADIVAQIGKPVPEIFAALVPDLSVADRESLAGRILISLVERIGRGEGEHYAGAGGLVRALADAGIRLFTVSNGRHAYIEAILEAAGVRECFEAVPHLIGAGVSDKTQLAAVVLKQYGLVGTDVLLVGDRAADRDAALANQIRFIACSYGHGSSDEWQGATAVIARPDELLAVVTQMQAAL